MKKILTTLFLSLLFSGFAYSESIKITISHITGTYDGETKGWLSKANGYGTLKSVSGDVYVGKFLNNRFKSVLHCTNGGWQYFEEYNRGGTITYNKFLGDCDQNKINIGDYKKIETKRTKEKVKKVLRPTLIFFLVMASIVFLIGRIHKLKLADYNKEHKTELKTYDALEIFLEKKEEKKYKEEEIKEKQRELIEAKKIAIEQKKYEQQKLKEERSKAREAKVTTDKPSSSNLGASLKRLKKMHNDGHLSKVEFEKAKNKLLK